MGAGDAGAHPPRRPHLSTVVSYRTRLLLPIARQSSDSCGAPSSSPGARLCSPPAPPPAGRGPAPSAPPAAPPTSGSSRVLLLAFSGSPAGVLGLSGPGSLAGVLGFPGWRLSRRSRVIPPTRITFPTETVRPPLPQHNVGRRAAWVR